VTNNSSIDIHIANQEAGLIPSDHETSRNARNLSTRAHKPSHEPPNYLFRCDHRIRGLLHFHGQEPQSSRSSILDRPFYRCDHKI